MEIVDSILAVLDAWGGLLPRPFETKGAMSYRLKGQITKPQYERGVRHLASRGLIKVINKNNERFIELTKKGQLKILLSKAKQVKKQTWDGKWRVIIFDIPEDSKYNRELFRNLLKTHGFYKLQASVYINPYPLNRSAIAYLNETGLIEYIRVLRVDEMDNDKKLKKYFKLT
jgi:CRISPR-associated endonuclease Cas2